MAKRYWTGAELMERWGILPFDLCVLLAKDDTPLHAYDPNTFDIMDGVGAAAARSWLLANFDDPSDDGDGALSDDERAAVLSIIPALLFHGVEAAEDLYDWLRGDKVRPDLESRLAELEAGNKRLCLENDELRQQADAGQIDPRRRNSYLKVIALLLHAKSLYPPGRDTIGKLQRMACPANLTLPGHDTLKSILDEIPDGCDEQFSE